MGEWHPNDNHTFDVSRDGLDVRWDGVSHQDIVAMTQKGAGVKATAMLESGLKNAASALTDTGDLINTVLQRVNGGEWTGNAAAVAAQAMQVMRDFDDTMTHQSSMNHLAAYGQSDNANWARTSIPPVVDTRAARVPTGSPVDVLGNTVDYQHAQAAATAAEEQARQVMRDYQSMTAQRIAALPPITPPPQVVIADEPDTIVVPPGAPGPSAPRDEVPDIRRAGAAVAGPPPGGAGPDASRVTPPGPAPSGTDPATTTPAETVTPRLPVTPSPAGSGPGFGEVPRTGPTPIGAFPVGGPGADAGRSPLRGGDQGQRIGAGPGGGRCGGPGAGVRSGVPETAGRGGATVVGRGAAKGVTSPLAPFGTAGAGTKSDEDKEHQVKYKVPGSEIFEPDNDDGLLHDPFRPGSYVAPSAIGDEDDE